jgi:predicted phosphodiesterase
MKKNELEIELLTRKVAKLEGENRSLKSHAVRLAESIERHTKAKGKFKSLNLARPERRSEGDRIRIVLGDTHGSALDIRAAAACLTDVRMLKPDEIVHLGDFVNCGGFLAQHHVMGFVAETSYSYEDDIAAANKFLDSLQQAAPDAEKHLIEGNHDRRPETWAVTETLRHSGDAKWLRDTVAPEMLCHLADRGIKYYRQDRCYDGLPVQGTLRLGKCDYWHGTSCAKHAAAVNSQKVGGNICYGHTHRMDAWLSSPMAIGAIGAWNPGCLCLKQPLWRHTDPTGWTNGYAIQLVQADGKFLHINIPIIDGKSLLGPLMNQIR